jgi:polar amino acid transport system substrate-binding protein
MVTEEWAPFRMNDETAPSGFRGIDIDLTQELQARLHTPITIERRPWGRALEMMRSGQADLITGVAYSADRAQYMLFVPTPYTAVQPVFITTKGRGPGIRSYADLAGKTIAFSLNSDYFEPFNSDRSLQKVGLTDEAQILRVISLGRVDVAIGTDPNLSWDIARGGYGARVERTAYQPPDRTDLFIAVSKKSPLAARLDEIDAALKGMLADGSIADILGRYR